LIFLTPLIFSKTMSPDPFDFFDPFDFLLDKLRQFHLDHQTPPQQTIADLHEAFGWLPRYTYAEEAKPLIEVSRKRSRKVQAIGELLIPLLIKLGVGLEGESGVDANDQVELQMSEARSSD
jgi:hypothetical protein